MHLRRALLLFALVLGLTALATSIAPTQQQTPTDSAPQPAPQQAAPASAVKLSFGGVSKSPPVQRVAAGAHVIVTVSPGAAGQVSLPQLGRVETVTTLTPATFDLIAPPIGRYEVAFTPPTGGPGERVGTLETTG